MSSSESYQYENVFLSADEEENQSQHFNSDEEEMEEISASFSGLQPYQLNTFIKLQHYKISIVLLSYLVSAGINNACSFN